jgi:hypothetical protein
MDDRHHNDFAKSTDRHLSLFTVVDAVIRSGNGRALEDKLSFLEADAMLQKIGGVLAFVPFKPHRKVL